MKSAKHLSGLCLLFLKYKECKQSHRPEHFLFTSTISEDVNKSPCGLLFWPFLSYQFAVPTGNDIF
jgi:hypothetical protein